MANKYRAEDNISSCEKWWWRMDKEMDEQKVKDEKRQGRVTGDEIYKTKEWIDSLVDKCGVEKHRLLFVLLLQRVKKTRFSESLSDALIFLPSSLGEGQRGCLGEHHRQRWSCRRKAC